MKGTTGWTIVATLGLAMLLASCGSTGNPTGRLGATEDASGSYVSITFLLTNNTEMTLQLDPQSNDLEHGKWVTAPPTSIAAGADGGFVSASSSWSLMSTQGAVQYNVSNSDGEITGKCVFRWYVPTMGANQWKYDCNGVLSRSGDFSQLRKQEHSWNPKLKFSVDPA